MKNLHKLIYITFGALSLSSLMQANAQVLTQWTFGGSTPLSAATGAGTASSVGMTTNYGSGSTDASGALSSTLAPDTGKVYRIVGSNGWNSAAPIGDQGAQFVTSTVGFDDISLSFDIDITAQGSANLFVQYTTNGTTWNTTPLADYTSGGTASASLGTGALTISNNTSSSNTVSGGYLSGLGDAVASTDTWFQGVTINLSSISGVNNDANFGIRIVNASTGADDLSLKGTALNNTSGNWRLDNVTIDGSAIVATPEPGTYALMLGGLVALVFFQRCRKGLSHKS